MDLSDDCWVNILFFLDVEFLGNICCVNKRLNEICRDEKGIFWKYYAKNNLQKESFDSISGWKRFLKIFGKHKLEFKLEPKYEINLNGIISDFQGKIIFPTLKTDVKCYEIL